MRIILFCLLTALCLHLPAQTPELDKIQVLYSQGKIKEAAQACNNALKKTKGTDPNYKELVKLRLSCDLELKKYKETLEDYRILQKMEPKSVEHYLGAATVHWILADKVNTLANMKKAYALDSLDPGTLNSLAYYTGQMGKYDESMKYANKGFATPKLSNVLKGLIMSHRAYVYIMRKEYDQALEELRAAIVFHPKNPLAYHYRALAHIGLKQMDTVCNDLERSRNLGNGDQVKPLEEKYCKKNEK